MCEYQLVQSLGYLHDARREYQRVRARVRGTVRGTSSGVDRRDGREIGRDDPEVDASSYASADSEEKRERRMLFPSTIVIYRCPTITVLLIAFGTVCSPYRLIVLYF